MDHAPTSAAKLADDAGYKFEQLCSPAGIKLAFALAHLSTIATHHLTLRSNIVMLFPLSTMLLLCASMVSAVPSVLKHMNQASAISRW
jgi:hypothetical protein